MVTSAVHRTRFLAPGDKLGKHELIRQIAVGGMAELYLGRTVGLEGFEKLVVLKRILPQYAANASFVNMFLNEARLAATLHHPNIAQVFDIGQDGGDYFFAMEYIHGEDLGRLVATASESGVPLSLDASLTLIAGLCAGLHYAHEKAGPDGKPLNVVHRDVSPSNVLVSYEGAVKVVDFGIARAGSNPSTTKGGLKGKVAYMSPEQCRGKATLDRRSDVFSIGTILYELTTGRLPFTDETEYGILNQIVNHDAEPPSKLVAGYSPALEAIVMRSLARDPDQRYATAQELQKAVEDFAHENRLRISPLVLARLMSTLFPSRLEEWDHARAQGAFFVEQHVVRTLIESGKADGAAPAPAPANDPTAAPVLTQEAGDEASTLIGPPPRLGQPNRAATGARPLPGLPSPGASARPRPGTGAPPPRAGSQTGGPPQRASSPVMVPAVPAVPPQRASSPAVVPAVPPQRASSPVVVPAVPPQRAASQTGGPPQRASSPVVAEAPPSPPRASSPVVAAAVPASPAVLAESAQQVRMKTPVPPQWQKTPVPPQSRKTPVPPQWQTPVPGNPGAVPVIATAVAPDEPAPSMRGPETSYPDIAAREALEMSAAERSVGDLTERVRLRRREPAETALVNLPRRRSKLPWLLLALAGAAAAAVAVIIVISGDGKGVEPAAAQAPTGEPRQAGVGAASVTPDLAAGAKPEGGAGGAGGEAGAKPEGGAGGEAGAKPEGGAGGAGGEAGEAGKVAEPGPEKTDPDPGQANPDPDPGKQEPPKTPKKPPKIVRQPPKPPKPPRVGTAAKKDPPKPKETTWTSNSPFLPVRPPDKK